MADLRMLVISDVHSSTSAAAMVTEDAKALSPDLIVVCGDVTHFGPPSFAESFLDSLPARTLAVPGNCDPPEVLRAMRARGMDLHEKRVGVRGVQFAGLGGSNLTPFDTLMEFDEGHIFSALEKVMVEGAVLVTHVPPKGRVDAAMNGVHAGSEAVARIVEKYRPGLSLSGHIHEARGIERDGTTVFVNPGPARKGFRAFVRLAGDAIEAELLG